MGDRPLVSLVTPSYNAERYLADTIESALAQSYRPLEIVVVDDGSTDGTAAVVAKFADRPEVVYVRKENGGPASARNLGIEVARGAFIGLLDSDDVWMPEKVDRCVAYLGEHPDVGWVVTDCYLMRDTVRTTDRYYGDFDEAWFPEGHHEQLATIARRNFLSVACVIRRDLFDRFGGFDEELPSSEDYDLWMRFFLGGSCVARIPEPLGWYRLHDRSLSANPAPHWETHLTVLERYANDLWTRGASIPARECHDIARRLARSGRRVDAARFAYRAARATDVDVRRRLRFSVAAFREVVAGQRAR